MGAIKELEARKHFSIAINWDDMPIEQHLEQYGAWLLLDNHYSEYLGSNGILGHLIDTENGIVVDQRYRSPPRCKIDVYHAMAVEDLLTHVMQTENDKVKRWIKTVVKFHIEFKTEEKIALNWDVSEYSVKRDKMLGIVRLATRFKLKSRLMESA